MKILYVYNEMPGVYQHYLLGLLSLVKQKLGVKTLVYKSSSSDFLVKSYGFRDRLFRFCYKLKLAKSNSSDVRIMRRFDVIHLQHSYLWKKLLPISIFKHRPKLIITLRGADTYLKPWSYFSLAEFYKNKSEHIDAFVVMSEHQKLYLKRWGIQEKKIHVIPISFGDISEHKPKNPNQDILKLASAFRMTWEKNIEGHIQFAKTLKDRGILFSYDIYGGGSDIDQLYFLVDKYQLQDVINIKGKVENSVLRDELPNYDFFVQLSVSESLGMSVIEAQSCGVPCVVSNSGGLSEIVIKDKTAIVEDYNNISNLVDSCLDLWKNQNAYYTYSQNAITHVNSKFTIQEEFNKLESLYNHLHNS